MRSMMARILGPRARPVPEPAMTLTQAVLLSAAIRQRGYHDARVEAHTACRSLGLMPGTSPDDANRQVGDLVRAAYNAGRTACETRLDSPDMADAICTALETPAAVLPQRNNESLHSWQVRAVQQVVAYGLAKR